MSNPTFDDVLLGQDTLQNAGNRRIHLLAGEGSMVKVTFQIPQGFTPRSVKFRVRSPIGTTIYENFYSTSWPPTAFWKIDPSAGVAIHYVRDNAFAGLKSCLCQYDFIVEYDTDPHGLVARVREEHGVAEIIGEAGRR